MKFYFITGAQDLYGEETLRLVAKNSRAIVNGLNKAGTLPFKLELKKTAISDSAITEVMLEANSDPDCGGIITWMHTFSPAKM